MIISVLINCFIPRMPSGTLPKWSTDADLTFNEKRAILASWASDACAVRQRLIYVPGRRAQQSALTISWKHCGSSIDRQTATSTVGR